jgi:hypothetical protein
MPLSGGMNGDPAAARIGARYTDAGLTRNMATRRGKPMSQADRITITSWAARPRPLSPVEMAHIRMITRRAVTKPNRIIGAFADRIDVEDRAEHLADVMAAVVEYATAIVTDTADLVPVGTIVCCRLAQRRSARERAMISGWLSSTCFPAF